MAIPVLWHRTAVTKRNLNDQFIAYLTCSMLKSANVVICETIFLIKSPLDDLLNVALITVGL